MSRFTTIVLTAAVLTAIFLTFQVNSRTGQEAFICEGGETCSLRSGWGSLFFGASVTGPFLAALGIAWSRRLHYKGQLGPFVHKAIPDGEQILEVLSVLAAGLFTYWFIRNGPSIEPARPFELGHPNSWALDIRNFRLEDGARAVTTVPSRRSWFLIGIVLSAPFAISFGTMMGREFYGRRRRQAQRQGGHEGDESTLTDDQGTGVSNSELNLDELDSSLDLSDESDLPELEAGKPEPSTDD